MTFSYTAKQLTTLGCRPHSSCMEIWGQGRQSVQHITCRTDRAAHLAIRFRSAGQTLDRHLDPGAPLHPEPAPVGELSNHFGPVCQSLWARPPAGRVHDAHDGAAHAHPEAIPPVNVVVVGDRRFDDERLHEGGAFFRRGRHCALWAVFLRAKAVNRGRAENTEVLQRQVQ